MFEHLTRSALLTIMRAQEEARRMSHNYVGTAELLLGLMRDDEFKSNPHFVDVPLGIASKAFMKCGVSLAAARQRADVIDPVRSLVAVEIPFTNSCKRILQRSVTIAAEFGDKEIDTEHLLLALLEEDEEAASHEVLVAMNVDKQSLYEEALKLRAERYKETL